MRTLPPVPARATAGITALSAVHGRTVEELKVLPALVDERGALAPGVLGILADSGLGHAVATTLDEGVFLATTYLHLVLLGRLRPEDDRYVIDSTLDVPAEVAARGEIRREDGTCVARASLGSVRLGAPPLQVLRAVDVTPVPAPRERAVPIDDFLCLDVVEHPSGAATAHWQADSSLANSAGGVHGGVGFLVGTRVLDVIAGWANPDADLTDVRAVFVRPIPADGSCVRVSIDTQHRGRRLHVAQAVLHDQGGRPAVIVDATHVVY